MNDDIRAAVAVRLEEKGMSRADLARAVGKAPQEISRALNGRKDGGRVPELWASIFDALDVRLTLTPGAASGQRVEVPKGTPGRKPTKPGERKMAAAPTSEALAPAVAHSEAKYEDEGLDAAPLFDEARGAAVGTPDPGRLAFVPGVLAPKGLSGTARRVLEAVAAGGKLARVGDRWQLNEDGQARSVDPRTVARLLSAGVLAHVEGEG